jgi:hypothetical protein
MARLGDHAEAKVQVKANQNAYLPKRPMQWARRKEKLLPLVNVEKTLTQIDAARLKT